MLVIVGSDVSRNRKVPTGKFNSDCRSCQSTRIPLDITSPREGVGFTLSRTFRRNARQCLEVAVELGVGAVGHFHLLSENENIRYVITCG